MINIEKSKIRKLCLSRPSQNIYTFITNDAKIERMLFLSYGEYLRDTEFETGETILIIEYQASYILELNNIRISTQEPLAYIFNYIYENTKFDQNVIALHGAAVEYDGFAHLFIGRTQSGKTTLTSYLIANNFGYITEDCILINIDSLEVIPYHTPLHLRDGGIKVLKKYNVPVENLDVLKINDLDNRYVLFPSCSVEKPIPISCVYLMNWNSSTDSLILMNEPEKIISLLTAFFSPRTIEQNVLRAVSRLASLNFYRLAYNDISKVKSKITNEKIN